MNRLAGKTVLITGAAAGIGKACAEALDALHVNIQHALIMPTAHRNPYVLHREAR